MMRVVEDLPQGQEASTSTAGAGSPGPVVQGEGDAPAPQLPSGLAAGASATLPEAFTTTRAVVLVPGKSLDQVMSVVEVLVQEGLDLISISCAGEADLATLLSIYSFRATIGAHDVRSVSQAHSLVQAGAAFAICTSPEPAALKILCDAGVPVLMDALTPSEVIAAWQPGVAAVHVRPAHLLGRDYAGVLTELAPQTTLVPTADTNAMAEEWLSQGATAVSLSSSVLSKVFISDDLSSLRQRAADTVVMLKRHR